MGKWQEMSRQYWIKSGRSVAGPFSREQVVQMAEAGGIRPGDLISTDQVNWRLAERAPEPVKGASPGAPERPKLRGPIIIAVGVAAVVLIGAGVWFLRQGGDDQSGRPADRPVAGRGADEAGPSGSEAPAPPQLTAVDRAAKCAPFETMGIVHVEAAPVAGEVFGWIRKQKDLFPGTDPDGFEKAWMKVAAIDVFLVKNRAGSAPMPVVVFHGRPRVSDIQEIAKRLSREEFPLKPGANGRYDALSPSMPVRLICGAEADDLSDDLILAGPAPLVTDALVGGLGTGDPKRLGGMLAGVDVSAPIWGAVELPETLYPEAPRLIAGSLDPRSGGRAAVSFTFRKAKDARDFEQQFLRREDSVFSPVLSIFQIKSGDTKIALTAESTADLVRQSIASVARARTLAKRVKSGAQLKAIGTGIVMYAVERRDRRPKDLAELVAGNHVTLEMLVSPSGDTPLTGWDAKAGRVPGDYVYLPLPLAAPPELLMAYERPELNGGEGTNVLLASTAVKWVKPDDLQGLLRRTRAWLAEYAKRR